MYNACPTRPVGSPLHPGLGRRRIRTSTRRGSHRIYRHADGRRVVVAYDALDDTFPMGILRAMIAEAGWPGWRFAEIGAYRIVGVRSQGKVHKRRKGEKYYLLFVRPNGTLLLAVFNRCSMRGFLSNVLSCLERER